MLETNGGTPRKPAHLFIDLERAESWVEEARQELRRAERAEREARERVIGLLRRVGGPVGWDRRVFTPVHASAGGPVVDFRFTEFVHAGEIAPEATAAAFVPPEPAAASPIEREVVGDFRAAAGRPEPTADEPPPFGVEPLPTARELVRSGRAVEAAELALIDGGEG